MMYGDIHGKYLMMKITPLLMLWMMMMATTLPHSKSSAAEEETRTGMTPAGYIEDAGQRPKRDVAVAMPWLYLILWGSNQAYPALKTTSPKTS